jgi:AraC family transcriptional regulator
MKKTGLILIAGLFLLSGNFEIASIASLSRNDLATQSQSVTVKIQKVEPFAYFCLKHKGPFSAMQEVIQRLMLESQSQNVFPSGPLMGIYYGSPGQVQPDQMEWEVGFPVTPHALVQPPLEYKEWNFTEVAVSTHRGPYEKAGETIAKMMEWMGANGYEAAGPVMERYMDMDPEEMKPGDLTTEIWIPVKSSRGR